MPDVSVYVALITGAVALTPQVLIWRQNVAQAKRAQHEQHEAAVRDACTALYNAATDVQTQVRNNHEYHGDGIGERLAEAWRCAAEARKHANSIALLAPRALAASAWQLAVTADQLTEAAATNIKLGMGASVDMPDCSELEKARGDFSAQAAEYFSGSVT
jgi:hypothetical protein